MARRNLPGIELPTAVRSTGVPRSTWTSEPEALPATVRAAAADVLNQVAGTVGVITAMDRTVEVGEWLAEVADERLQVVGSLEAKGMEYDGVLLVEPVDLLTAVTSRRADAVRRPVARDPAAGHRGHRRVVAADHGPLTTAAHGLLTTAAGPPTVS